jgi:hypothetical protein
MYYVISSERPEKRDKYRGELKYEEEYGRQSDKKI